jgi:hypothetical protein
MSTRAGLPSVIADLLNGLMKAAQALPKDLQELAKSARQVVADQLRRPQTADSETDP